MGQNNTIKILLIILTAISISFILHFILVNIFVEQYFNNNHKELYLLDFYNQKKINESNLIFFWGSSQMESGINPLLIEDILNNFNYSSNIYNLGIEGDTPVRRIPEISPLIANKPRIVVIGLSYYELYYYNNQGNEDIRIPQVFSFRPVILDENTKNFFYEDELKLINNPLEQYKFKKAYLLMSIENFISQENPNTWKNNVKSLYMDLTRSLSEKEKINEYSQNINYFNTWKVVGNENNRQKNALNYTINKLKENNITVVLINMPLYSLLSKNIPNETKSNYTYFINSMGVPYYNLETKYPDDEFGDLIHLNKYGRTNLSKDLALIILDNGNINNSRMNYTWVMFSNDKNDIIHIENYNIDNDVSFNTQDGLTLFKINSKNKTNSLKISLGDGWYNLESDGKTKWRWLGEQSGMGVIEITNYLEDLNFNLSLEYGSALQNNSLYVYLDTKNYGQCSSSSECKIQNILLSNGKHKLFLNPKIGSNNKDLRDNRNLVYLFTNITISINKNSPSSNIK